MNSKVAIVILAAGASSRLGQPKQKVKYNGRTLLDITIDLALTVELGEVVVVLGANEEKFLRRKEVRYIINEEWVLGLGRSFAVGISQLSEETEAAVIMLCDQPFMTQELIRDIVAEGQKSEDIVVSDYGEGSGPPCYFDKKYFPELKKLSGDTGAKAIVNKTSKLVKVSFPDGKYDIDLPQDLNYLI